MRIMGAITGYPYTGWYQAFAGWQGRGATMSMDPRMTQDQAFWRTSGELRHLLAGLRAELGESPHLRDRLAEIEAIQSSLERQVRYSRNPLQHVVGFP